MELRTGGRPLARAFRLESGHRAARRGVAGARRRLTLTDLNLTEGRDPRHVAALPPAAGRGSWR